MSTGERCILDDIDVPSPAEEWAQEKRDAFLKVLFARRWEMYNTVQQPRDEGSRHAKVVDECR